MHRLFGQNKHLISWQLCNFSFHFAEISWFGGSIGTREL